MCARGVWRCSRSRQSTEGFHDNCQRKFPVEGTDIWERMNDVFEFLPVAALVDNTTLCIHGGIGDSINSLDDLRGIPKPIQVVGEITASTTRQDSRGARLSEPRR